MTIPETTRPADCSICRKITFVTLVKGCTWLCHSCKRMLDLKEK